jgi:hypothetical protein
VLWVTELAFMETNKKCYNCYAIFAISQYESKRKILTAVSMVAALSMGFNMNKSNQKQLSANITYHNPLYKTVPALYLGH